MEKNDERDCGDLLEAEEKATEKGHRQTWVDHKVSINLSTFRAMEYLNDTLYLPGYTMPRTKR